MKSNDLGTLKKAPGGKGNQRLPPSNRREDEISTADAETRGRGDLGPPRPRGKGRRWDELPEPQEGWGSRSQGRPGAPRGQGLGAPRGRAVQGVPAEAPAPLLTSPNWKAETMVTTTPTKQT